MKTQLNWLSRRCKSALADGKVTDKERVMIENAAVGLSKAKKDKLTQALESGEITKEVEKILKNLIINPTYSHKQTGVGDVSHFSCVCFRTNA